MELTIDGNLSGYQQATPKAAGDWSTWSIGYNVPVGSHWFVARVTDCAGNQDWNSVDINAATPVGDDDDQFQQGDTANIRFKLTDQNNNKIINATVILQIQQVDSSNNPIGPLMNATSSGGSNDGYYFRYSASAKLYQYNLKTDNMAVGKWALYVYLIDTSTQPATNVLLENAPIDGISMTIFIK